MKIFQSALTKIMNTYSADFSKALLHTGVVGYASSSAAQVGSIILKDDTTAENKKYMIHQEITEGAVNTLLFYTVCQYVKAKTEQLINQGNILPKTTRALLDELKVKQVENVGLYLENLLEKSKNPEMTTKIIKALEHLKVYMIPTVTTAAAFGAAVLASNIIAPICRNLIAGHLHKKEQKVMRFSNYEI